jgi:hypothetical protein
MICNKRSANERQAFGRKCFADETKARRLSCVSVGKEEVKWKRFFKEGARWSSEDTTTRREKKPKWILERLLWFA